MTYKHKYHFFYGWILSNWYIRDFVIDGLTYFCVEQYMMASKALLFNDRETFAKIMKATTPKECKALGRAVKGFVEDIWKRNRERIVYKGLCAKFNQNQDLYEQLMQIDAEIFVEASPVDHIWGIKLGMDHPDRFDHTKWRGLNLLGKLITIYRNRSRDKDGNTTMDADEPPETLVIDLSDEITILIDEIDRVVDPLDYLVPIMEVVSDAIKYKGTTDEKLEKVSTDLIEDTAKIGIDDVGAQLAVSGIKLGVCMQMKLDSLGCYDHGGLFDYDFTGFLQRGVAVFAKTDPVGEFTLEKQRAQFRYSWPHR